MKKPTADDLLQILAELVAWADMMGGWESPVWEQARIILASGQRQIKTPTPTSVARFKGLDLEIRVEAYQSNKAPALRLYHNGMPYLTATINLPYAHLPPGKVLIKDYSENAGILAALEAAGVVRRTGQMLQAGYGKAHVVELLLEYDYV